MKAKTYCTLFLLICVLVMTVSCSSSSGDGAVAGSDDPVAESDDPVADDQGNGSTSSATAGYEKSVADEYSASYQAADVLANTFFSYTVHLDFDANTVAYDNSALQPISAEGVEILPGITVAATTTGIAVTSTSADPVIYRLCGSLGGTLSLSSDTVYQLYLDGVTISATDGPALNLASATRVFIVTADGTTNLLADSAARSLTMKAALYGKGPMIFEGTGTLTVDAAYKHGIFSNDYIRVCNGTLSVTVSARDAVRSVNGFIFDDGDLTINANGTATDDESKGIKVEGAETTGSGKGDIVINGGKITITSVGKAITAGWDIDEDAETAETTDDPNPDVTINNGVITLTTTGIPYEYYDSTAATTVSCSPEGIEAKSDLIINSGYFIIHTTDDSLNAGASLTINGGRLYCESGVNDAIDANGPLSITGGVIVACGSTAPEGAFDCDQNAFSITGGTLIGTGGTTSTPSASTSSQNVVVLSGMNVARGEVLALTTSTGSTDFACTMPSDDQVIVLSSPQIASGTVYTIYTGGSAASEESFEGLFIAPITYSGGTAGNSFSTASRVTYVGTSTGGTLPGGAPPR